MAGTLQDKVALVTGAGRGIGLAIAGKLASQGARVVVNDMDEVLAQQAVNEIVQRGGQALACAGSVTTEDFGERIVAAAMDAWGSVDIIVNNAGYTWDNVIQKMSDEQWYAILDVHLTAPFRILRAAQPVIRELVRQEQAKGISVARRVVNISSVAGLFGNPGQANYAAAKAGVEGLTKTLAKEWGRLNVTVNCVAYGLINTRLTAAFSDAATTASIDGREIRLGVQATVKTAMEQAIPLGRGGTPDEAAGAVYLFCLPEADYISGQTLVCSGGLTGI